jgi:Na+-transporting methylmalonyl-CoA/oxaloacetate decarboxylase gamma subunit
MPDAWKRTFFSSRPMPASHFVGSRQLIHSPPKHVLVWVDTIRFQRNRTGMNFSYQNVVEGQGIEIAMTGMAIVFTALVLISVFIALLPRVLVVLNPFLPETTHHGHAPSTAPSAAAGTASADQEEEARIAVAIGVALRVYTGSRER